jgi:replicative DNA helicase
LRPGQLVVVAARPGIGKTALAGCTALRAAKRGVPVLVFSLEMAFAELAERFLGAQSRMSVETIGRGVSGAAMRELFAASRDLSALPLWVDDRILNAGQIASAARSWRVRNQGKRALVVVDYLGLIKPQGRSETRALEVGRMAWAAKMLAKDLACPLILVAQLNRGNEKEGRKPVLSDLRDSGEIEQHADVVIFPNREPPLEDSGEADLIVAKNRGGKTGKVSCYWNAPLMVFEGLAREEGQHGERPRYSDAAE